MVTANDKSAGGESDRRVFVRTKSNIGLDDGGFACAVEQRLLENYPDITASCVSWFEAINVSAREIPALVGTDETGSNGAENRSILRKR